MSALQLTLVVLFFLAELTLIQSSKKWSYVGTSGPRYWHELFPSACGGENQSPIDLRPEQTLYDPSLKEFAIWYDPPKPDSRMILKNNGHTVQVDLEGDFFLSNGGLHNVYRAVQFHFHWGDKSHQGSEHLVDGKASPIEMHVVTFNRDLYSDVGEAVTRPGGLAVLGVLFELSEEDNPKFEYIIRGMKMVRNPDVQPKVELPLFSLRDLLPADTLRYFRYNGSLTTPGCFETVTWTVFDQMQTISHKQMEQFRKLLQYSRLKHHRHHNKDHTSSSSRQKRELSQAEREHNSKKVLDELGIRGKDNDFQRETLKDQLVHDKSSMGTIVEGGDKSGQEPIYVQDYIVNNFRPVQPINDRLVYRSFKLRSAVAPSSDRAYDSGRADTADKVQYQTLQHQHSKDNNNGAAATGKTGITSFIMSIALLVCSYIITTNQLR